MAGVSYRGKSPTSDASVVTKKWIEDRHTALTLTDSQIDQVIAPTKALLADKAYVDAGDSTRAKKTLVDAADNTYIPLTERGVAGGVVPLDATNYVPATLIPGTLITDRPHRVVDANQVYLNQVTNTNLSGTVTDGGAVVNGKEYLAATLTVSDPGTPYLLLPFATVAGRCPNVTSGSFRRGGDTFGKMVALTQNDICWGFGMTGNATGWAIQQLLPFTGKGGVPTNATPISGDTTLSLWLSNWSGTTYQWASTGFSFYTWVVPAG